MGACYQPPAWKVALRPLLRKAQGGDRARCAVCGDLLTAQVWADPRWNRATFDHVIPRALRGLNGPGNMVLAHSGCNSWKGDRPPTGCELVWLLAVNARIGAEPLRS